VDGAFVSATQLGFAQNIGSKMQLYAELLIWQSINRPLNIPFVKAFYSWFPHPRFTLYATTTSFYEWGAGAKFLITQNFELEFLTTKYIPTRFVRNWFGNNVNTFNIGLRYRIAG